MELVLNNFSVSNWHLLICTANTTTEWAYCSQWCQCINSKCKLVPCRYCFWISSLFLIFGFRYWINSPVVYGPPPPLILSVTKSYYFMIFFFFSALFCYPSFLLQVRYHLRFTYSPRNAPSKEKSELNPNNDLDWHTLSLFPLFQLPGPREQHDPSGGTPGQWLDCFTTCIARFIKVNLHLSECFKGLS